MSAIVTSASKSVPVWFVNKSNWIAVRKSLPASGRAFADDSSFQPTAGRVLTLPDGRGGFGGVLLGTETVDAKFRDPLLPGKLVATLPGGVFHFANDPAGGKRELELAALSWALAAYKFSRYKKSSAVFARLVCPKGVDAKRIERIAAAVAMVRDLVNTPANDMGPDALETAALALAKGYRAKAKVIRGVALLRHNFPLIHAVGRASVQEPRLVDFTWGPARGPKITLVGKGVCFDTGGLDIKPSSAMLMMKKDMAGAATVLGLARMIMDAKLPVRLRVLLPIVENSVSGNSFRPGDIYRSRKGFTVEIGNTDAEGRLILADALALADEESPDLLVDMATLTGAARVALGPDLPPFYATDEGFATDIMQHGSAVHDPMWRLPLWDPYDSLIDGKISDLNNVSAGPFAGSITAALFLRRFVTNTKSWAHFDIYAWNPSTRPGRPEGGEAQISRALFDLLETHYGKGR